jgi:hypothetical protein
VRLCESVVGILGLSVVVHVFACACAATLHSVQAAIGYDPEFSAWWVPSASASTSPLWKAVRAGLVTRAEVATGFRTGISCDVQYVALSSELLFVCPFNTGVEMAPDPQMWSPVRATGRLCRTSRVHNYCQGSLLIVARCAAAAHHGSACVRPAPALQ